MTSPFRGQALRPRAIELMKAGHTASELHARFVGEGEDPEEIRAVLTELVALQQQAAAMDPTRLRGEAMGMFFRGASVEDVVGHFVRVGIAEPHARGEVAKILAHVQAMKPCQRCGTPSARTDLTYDLSGFMLCRRCALQDEIGRSEARGLAAELENMGPLGGAMWGIAQTAIESQANNYGHTSQPFCGPCRAPTGIHTARLDAGTRARLDPSAEWVCTQCWCKIA